MRLLAAVVLLVLPACGRGDDEVAIRVLAAASLTDALTDVGAAFEHAAGIGVAFSFGG